jgi:hypothetical protein
MSSNYTGLTPNQYQYLAANYSQAGFVANSSRINTYNNPVQNTADRNWQEMLKADKGYAWGPGDKESWSQNCAYGPHNSAQQFDAYLYPKKG